MKTGPFDASFEQSEHLVADEFIRKEVLKTEDTPNIGQRILGMTAIPIFILLLGLLFRLVKYPSEIFGSNRSIVFLNSINNVLNISWITVIIFVVIIGAIFRNNIEKFMVVSNSVLTVEFILLNIPIMGLQISAAYTMGWGIIVGILLIILEVAAAAVFIYNERQSVRSVLFTSEKFNVVSNQMLKKIGMYVGPILLVIIVMNSIFAENIFLGGLGLYIGRFFCVVLMSAEIVGSIYFGFSYCFYHIALSYYYINKYKEDYDLSCFTQNETHDE
ncbi:hypothetical protein [Companilactobacillus mishanensis]|uniref:hypothetical protein n=1 Tax=Companilactobacillus mishanensis TaxID=2486008 RepID=UPI001295F189|nr:hypothetical protein [Companilactobacillus mishanensis]MQS89241.1 hypothetical protein [Companilactobacillus mishanensis]